MDPVALGGFVSTYRPYRISRVIDFERALEEIRAVGLYRAYETSLEVGRAAQLLETLRGQEKVPVTRVADFASQFGYTPSHVERILIPQYEAWGVITSDESGITVAANQQSDVLRACDAAWETAPKTRLDEATVEILSTASRRPVIEQDLRPGYEERFGSEVVTQSILALRATNLLSASQGTDGSTLLFNPYSFTGDKDALERFARDTSGTALSSLEGALSEIWEKQGYPASHSTGKSGLGLDANLLDSSVLAGVLNRVDVTTPRGKQGFLFTADVLPVEGASADAFHEVKQTVAHFRYAQSFAATRLWSLPLFLSKLLDRGEAGSVPAIGTDYQELERRGIVEVRRLGASGNFRLYVVPGKENILRETLNLIQSGVPSVPRLHEVPLGEQLTRLRTPPESRAQIDPALLGDLTATFVSKLRRLR